MARPSDELDAAWRYLRNAPEESEGWRTAPISRGGAVVMHAGRRFPGGQEAILTRFASATLPGAAVLPEGLGFRVERANPKDDGNVWIALTRKADGSVDVFGAMARDIADALDGCTAGEEPRALATLLGRVRSWQEFMRKGVSTLSPEAELGLYGELTSLVTLIEAGVDPTTACLAWQGPIGGLRDFELGTGGIEVKSTLSSSGFPARIGSLDQLDDSVRQPLYVFGVRVRQSSTGTSLPDKVELLKDLVAGDHEAERVLAERLIAAGYVDAHAASYARRFESPDLRVLPVIGAFPRMTPFSVPEGVMRASYEIDLEKVPMLGVSVVMALKELKAL